MGMVIVFIFILRINNLASNDGMVLVNKFDGTLMCVHNVNLTNM